MDAESLSEVAGMPWHARGACRSADVRIFFPRANEDAAPAREYCDTCPVAVECLSHALETRQRHGVWGGTTPKQRRRMLAQSA